MIGISREEFEFLCSSEAKKIIETNIEKDHTTLALKGVSATLCRQIKYLQRSRSKIPHYYAARCIIPPLSYEQSSSLLSSMTKNDKGDRFLDLTCGLGVDTMHYSNFFKEVVTIERDEIVADIAKENFKRLGANNIEVINSDCESYIANYQGNKFDLIYIDPARRDSTKRVFLLDDCSPNIINLIPRLSEIANRIVIKLSPLFDVKEADRIFGGGVTIRAISVNDECKELCVEIDFMKGDITQLVASCVGKKGVIREYSFDKEDLSNNHTNIDISDINSYKYISILDVALRKIRCCEAYYYRYHSEESISYDNEIALWMTPPQDVAGSLYSIDIALEYKPKLLKKILKEKGIKSATIIKQNFNMSLEDIRRRNEIKNGSGATLIFTTIMLKQYVFILTDYPLLHSPNKIIK